MCFRSVTPLIVLLIAASTTFAAPAKMCDLMTRQQAATLAGVAIGEGAEQNLTEGASMCLFSAPPPGGQTVSIGVMGKDAFYGAPAATIFKITTGAKQGETAETIPGLGENAVLIHSSNDDSLKVLYHEKIVILDASGSKNSGVKAALVAAAKLALGKL